jgi:hypothetical protein
MAKILKFKKNEFDTGLGKIIFNPKIRLKDPADLEARCQRIMASLERINAIMREDGNNERNEDVDSKSR